MHLALRSSWIFALLATALGLGPATIACAAPVVGFIEDFPAANGIGTWVGGATNSNPGTGGYGGVGDGYLDVLTTTSANLGAVSFGSEYAGDWVAAGITQVRCWLRDVSGRGDLLIHLSVNDATDSFQQNVGLNPPVGKWGLYVVNLVASDFTHIRGSTGTFAGVLQTNDRLLFRHDLAPYTQSPDPIAGEFGLDHILLTNGTTGVAPGDLAASAVLLDPPYPNPARGRVTFSLHSAASGPISLTVFDAAGRRVRRIELADAGAAPRLWLWDGRDDDGSPVPAGVYRVLARGANGGTSRTVTLLR